MKPTFATVICVVVAAAPLLGQWPSYPAPGIPRTPDGKADLNAPAPRTADGKPDLSGVWETAPCPNCVPPVIDGSSPPPAAGRGAALAPPQGRGGDAGGRGRGPIRNTFGNVGSSTPEGEAPYQPWAAELRRRPRS